MDGYPPELAPEFDEGGGVSTPFEEWWGRVQRSFESVPENVARFWLHEHWSHSPFGWLTSRNYKFELLDIESDQLLNIRTGWCNFGSDNSSCIEHGRRLIESPELRLYRTAKYMKEHRAFPQPIIILDNRDGHLSTDAPEGRLHDYPQEIILVEGHRRHCMALYLASVDKLESPSKVWMMTKRSSTES